MKRPDETQTQFALRLLAEEREQQIIKMIDAKLQEFDGYSIEGVKSGVDADLAVAAAEHFSSIITDAIRQGA